MKNKHLEVFTELKNQLLNYPRDTLWDKYLQIIVSEQIQKIGYTDGEFEPEKLSRQKIYAKAKNIDEKNEDSQTAKNAVKTSKLKAILDAFIDDQPDCKKAFIELGYRPIIVAPPSGGGSKNKALLWMDIQAIESERLSQEQIDNLTTIEPDSDIEEDEDLSTITYERKATSNSKLSLLVRLFFNKGELKIRSVKGISLMLLLMISFLAEIFIVSFSLLVLLSLNDLHSLKLWEAVLFLIFIPAAYLNWLYFLRPLYLLPYNRVIKAPMLFANINVESKHPTIPSFFLLKNAR